MKVLNRVLCVALCAFMICTACASAVFATESPLTAECEYSATQNQYTVYGSIDSDMGNSPVLLKIKAPDGSFFTGFETATEITENGNVYEFPPFNIPENATSGTYTLTVSAEFISASQEIPIDYLGINDQFALLKDVNSAISAEDSVYDIVAPKASYLSLSKTEVDAIGRDKAISNFNKQFEEYDIPEALNDDADKLKVSEAWKLLCEDAKNAVVFSSYVDIASNADATAWFDKYYSALGFDKENVETTQSETLINDYFKQVKGSDVFTKHLKTVTEILSEDDLREHIYESILLSAIESLHYSNTYTIFTNFPEYFDVDKAVLSSIYSQDRGSLYTDTANKFYENYQAAIDAFDALAKAKVDDDGDSKGSSSSKKDSIYFSDVITDTAEAETTGFADMYQAEWAREAVEYLTAKGIVNGHSKTIFAPQQNVTRAEFAKMVVLAKNISLDQQGASFADVSTADWHFAYVSAARNAGYIMGNTNNEFMPDASITRQDMATILKRAFAVEDASADAGFTDFDDVADYAKAAVSALAAKGLINGMGDGTFAPYAFATRAQAAQMIYNLLTNI